MRKIVLLEHVSLDGYLAGPDGAMDWITVDDEVWDSKALASGVVALHYEVRASSDNAVR